MNYQKRETENGEYDILDLEGNVLATGIGRYDQDPLYHVKTVPTYKAIWTGTDMGTSTWGTPHFLTQEEAHDALAKELAALGKGAYGWVEKRFKGKTEAVEVLRNAPLYDLPVPSGPPYRYEVVARD